MKYLLELRLESDLCPSSGENFGAHIDSDVTFDQYGLPFIPAKRIKGCLKEAAGELERFGLLPSNVVGEIFGTPGGQQGNLRIRNLYLEDYPQLVEEILSSGHSELREPRNIADAYTYTRSQTAIAENGIAKPHSLRTVRVIKRGSLFCGEMEFDEKYLPNLEKTAAAMRHIGLNRTRGLGLVATGIKPALVHGKKAAITGRVDSDTERYELVYTLKLVDAIMFPRTDGGAEKTESYIPGSSVMGFFAARMPGVDYKRLFYDGGLIFRNAYLSYENKRYIPAPVSLRKEKEQKFKAPCLNTLKMESEDYAPDEGEGDAVRPQYKAVGELYVADPKSDTSYLEAETEIGYHNNRQRKERGLYQYAALTAGQVFTGSILGAGADIKRIAEAWPEDGIFTLGRSKTAQYGRAEVTFAEVQKIRENGTSSPTSRFAVQLVSPCLIMDETTGAVIATWDVLKTSIAQKLQIPPETLSADKLFLRYKPVGGFNTTWQLPKPQLLAFDAGTVCAFRIEKTDIDISPILHTTIGARISEGYGEIIAYALAETREKPRLTFQEQLKDPKQSDGAGTLTETVLRRKKIREVCEKAVRDAQNKSWFEAGVNSTQIERISLLLKETEDDLEEFTRSYTRSKKAQKKLQEFLLKKKDEMEGEPELFRDYLNTFLTEAKYILRREENA